MLTAQLEIYQAPTLKYISEVKAFTTNGTSTKR